MTQLDPSIPSTQPRFVLPKGLRNFGQDYGALTALGMLIIFNLFFTHNLGSLDAIHNLLIQVTPTLIIAVGMTLVIATGGIDISVGSVMGFAGVIAYLIFSGKWLGIHGTFLGITVAIAVSLALSMVVGVVNGILVTRFQVQPIVATLIMLISIRGLAEAIINGSQFAFAGAPFALLFTEKIFGLISAQVVIALVIAALFIWLMRSTAFSRYVLASGGNKSAARLAGVPVNRVLILVYAISGLLAGIAGLISIAYVSAENPVSIGLGKELDAIAAVAAGGTPLAGGRASVVGTVIGAIFIQLIRDTVIALNVPEDISRIIIGAIILLAVYLQHERKA